MNDLLPDILQHFLLCLSLGTALFAWIADPKLTGAGFMRLIVGHGFIFLALNVLVGWFFHGAPPQGLLALEGLALLVLGVQWKFHPDKRTPVMWILFALQVVLTILLFMSVAKDRAAFFFFVSSALLLGVTHYSMLLGHYYLVVPKLTERPLLVCLVVCWALMVLKVAVSAWASWRAAPYLVEGTELGDGYVFNWLVVAMRWLWGYLALGILSWFAWRLCRMRSIQSATGVLYIMVFFVFIGELLSVYLFLKNGLFV